MVQRSWGNYESALCAMTWILEVSTRIYWLTFSEKIGLELRYFWYLLEEDWLEGKCIKTFIGEKIKRLVCVGVSRNDVGSRSFMFSRESIRYPWYVFE